MLNREARVAGDSGLVGVKRLRDESDVAEKEAVMGAIMMQDREEEDVEKSFD